jgi:hypothetical protein
MTTAAGLSDATARAVGAWDPSDRRIREMAMATVYVITAGSGDTYRPTPRWCGANWPGCPEWRWRAEVISTASCRGWKEMSMAARHCRPWCIMMPSWQPGHLRHAGKQARVGTRLRGGDRPAGAPPLLGGHHTHHLLHTYGPTTALARPPQSYWRHPSVLLRTDCGLRTRKCLLTRA